MKLQVTITVDADVDGWAHASGITAGPALMEIMSYLKTLNPLKGQTYLTHTGSTVRLDAGEIFPGGVPVIDNE